MKNRVKGGHYIIDFFGCDPDQINRIEFWQKELPLAAKEADMEILHSHFHQFEPEGITGFLLLSTSHLSIHTWPEYNYVACDVFSCSHGDDTKRAVEYLKSKLQHTRNEKHYIKRGYVMTDYLLSPLYSSNKYMNIKLKKKLAEINSNFQNIVVVDTEKFGKCLVIDKIIQTSDFDHKIYDNSLLKKMSNEIKNILILGGGDGNVAEEIYEKYPNSNISIVELDQEVIKCAKKYFKQEIFDKENVKLIIGDAVNFLKIQNNSKSEKYDLIISDLTDNPIGSGGKKNKTKILYEEIIDLSFELLSDNGWLAMQGGASKVHKKYVNVVKIISEMMNKKFGNLEIENIFIPSFGEESAFLFSQKNEN